MAYLKSEIGEIGHFWAILGFFLDFVARKGRRGFMDTPEGFIIFNTRCRFSIINMNYA